MQQGQLQDGKNIEAIFTGELLPGVTITREEFKKQVISAAKDTRGAFEAFFEQWTPKPKHRDSSASTKEELAYKDYMLDGLGEVRDRLRPKLGTVMQRVRQHQKEENPSHPKNNFFAHANICFIIYGFCNFW